MDKVKRFFIVTVETAVIVSIVLISVLPFSCKVSTQGIQILGGNYKVPQLLEVTVLDDKTVTLDFSTEVKLDNIIVSPFIDNVSDSYDISESFNLSPSLEAASGKYGFLKTDIEYGNNNKTAYIHFSTGTDVGKKYEIYGVVRDKTGNSLMFCIPFTGYNSRIPELKLTEVHPAMAGIQKTEDINGTRRLEYVEFIALSDGNLAGLEFCSGYVGATRSYVFPPVEVNAGEIVMLHLRTWGEGCISEENDNLDEAWSRYTGKYRDLWSENTSKPMSDKSDILVIREITSSKIIDAFMYSDYSIENWSDYLKTDFTQQEEFLDFYDDSSVSAAFNSSGIGTTKVFARNPETWEWSISLPSPGSL